MLRLIQSLASNISGSIHARDLKFTGFVEFFYAASNGIIAVAMRAKLKNLQAPKDALKKLRLRKF